MECTGHPEHGIRSVRQSGAGSVRVSKAALNKVRDKTGFTNAVLNHAYEMEMGVPPKSEEFCHKALQAEEEASIRGILLALRYLSREAEEAGFKELAKALKEAERECDRHAGTAQRLA